MIQTGKNLMQILYVVAITVVVITSFFGGLIEVMVFKDVIASLNEISLASLFLLFLGLLKILASVLLVIPKTRLFSSLLVLLSFTLTFIFVFKDGWASAAPIASLLVLPMFLSCFIFFETLQIAQRKRVFRRLYKTF